MAAAIYRTLIRLYPHAFWREFHDELEDDFAEGSREAINAGGPSSLALFWMHTTSDLCRSLVREWLRTPWLPVLLVAAAASLTLFGYTALTVSHLPVPARVRLASEQNADALKVVIVFAVGVLIPIIGTILGSLWMFLIRRRTTDRPRRRHV